MKTIEISDFVPYDEIDPIYFERTYYLGPQQGSEKVYALLRNAMEKTGLAAIAKYVMRDRQSLGCLRVREGSLTLEKMFFHDELRPVDEIAPKGVRIAKSELELATALIEQFTGTFEPERLQGHLSRDALQGDQGEAEGRDDHGPRSGGRRGACRPARRAQGLGRGDEADESHARQAPGCPQARAQAEELEALDD